VYIQLIAAQFDGEIGVVQEILHEIFLYQKPFITQANDKFIEPVMAVDLHDMPEDRLTTDLYHRLWSGFCFFCDPGAQAAGKNDYFHILKKVVQS
jgi:hypothetical protein